MFDISVLWKEDCDVAVLQIWLLPLSLLIFLKAAAV